MEVESALVTGANRGIGLEFVKQLVGLPKPPRYVFATYRNKETLRALEEVRDSSHASEVILIQMDVTKPDDLKAAQQKVEETVKDVGLTLLINNAGAIQWAGFPDITEENLIFHLTTNTVGPVMVLKSMLPLLQKAAVRRDIGMGVSRAAVLNISSMVASIQNVELQPLDWLTLMSHRTSKAALNMSMKVVALSVKDQGILVINMCPGWVKTDMGTEKAEITATESVSCMLATLSKLDESNHGTFMDRRVAERFDQLSGQVTEES